MDLSTIIYTQADGIAIITLNRPQVLNAMNKQLWLDLQSTLGMAHDDPQVRVVVITGQGRAFSSGASPCRRP